MNNKINTSDGNIQLVNAEGKVINVSPSSVYTSWNDETVSVILIDFAKSSGLAIFTSMASDLEINGTVYADPEDAQEALAEAIADAGGAGNVKVEVVEELPQEGEENTIYLVPAESGSTGDLYEEYVWIDGEWEKFGSGSISIDLSDYWTSAQTESAIEAAVSGKADSSTVAATYATKAEVIANEQVVSTALNGLELGKADVSALTAVDDVVTAHTANTNIHVTTAQTSAWDAKQDTLTAGTGLDITDDVISLTASTGGYNGFDYKIDPIDNQGIVKLQWDEDGQGFNYGFNAAVDFDADDYINIRPSDPNGYAQKFVLRDFSFNGLEWEDNEFDQAILKLNHSDGQGDKTETDIKFDYNFGDGIIKIEPETTSISDFYLKGFKNANGFDYEADGYSEAGTIHMQVNGDLDNGWGNKFNVHFNGDGEGKIDIFVDDDNSDYSRFVLDEGFELQALGGLYVNQGSDTSEVILPVGTDLIADIDMLNEIRYDGNSDPEAINISLRDSNENLPLSLEVTGDITDGQGNVLADKLDATAYTPTDLSEYWTSAQTESAITAATSGKQDVSGMTAYTSTATTDALNTVVTAHTADTNIHVTTAQTSAWDAKQTALTAGTGIDITNNVISVTGGSSVTVDTALDSGSTNPVANSAITSAINQFVVTGVSRSSDGSHEIVLFTKKNLATGNNAAVQNNIKFATINSKTIAKQSTSTSTATEEFQLVETSAITTSITSGSTDVQVPSAKAVYDQLGGIKLAKVTQAEYDALVQGGTVDADTLYLISNVVNP